MKGAIKKGHTWVIQSTPLNRAGPSERAGLTDVPVSGISMKWIIARVTPIASGASAGCSLRESVTDRITNTNSAVITSSTSNAAHTA